MLMKKKTSQHRDDIHDRSSTVLEHGSTRGVSRTILSFSLMAPSSILLVPCSLRRRQQHFHALRPLLPLSVRRTQRFGLGRRRVGCVYRPCYCGGGEDDDDHEGRDRGHFDGNGNAGGNQHALISEEYVAGKSLMA